MEFPRSHPAFEQLCGAERICSAKILTGLPEFDVNPTRFIARPRRTAVAKTHLEVREVRTGVRAAGVAGLLPEGKPLSRMIVADTSSCAHRDKNHSPN
jgi:hypothetical protein